MKEKNGVSFRFVFICFLFFFCCFFLSRNAFSVGKGVMVAVGQNFFELGCCG